MTEALTRILEAVRMVKPGLWIIGDKLQLSLRQEQPHDKENSTVCSWEDGQGSWFILDESNDYEARNSSKIIPRTIEHIYLAGGGGGAHAVWDLGAAFLKIINPESHATREHVTLDWIQQKQPSFAIPKVLYHGEWEGRYYLVLSRVPGMTLAKLWTRMAEDTKAKCVARISEICIELAEWHGDRIQGVDGGHLVDHYLDKSVVGDFDHETMVQKSKELGMDVSTLHFYHCDLGPTNVLYDNESDRLSVIDWETAGFVPKQWIRTKFRLSGGMDLECEEGESRYEYRKRMAISLEEKGFPDVAMRWTVWRYER